jgi:hypothetical protein
MLINVAAKLKDGNWRGATIVDNKFLDAAVDSDLSNVLSAAFVALFSAAIAEGSDLSVTIAVTPPEASA